MNTISTLSRMKCRNDISLIVRFRIRSTLNFNPAGPNRKTLALITLPHNTFPSVLAMSIKIQLNAPINNAYLTLYFSPVLISFLSIIHLIYHIYLYIVGVFLFLLSSVTHYLKSRLFFHLHRLRYFSSISPSNIFFSVC